MAKVFPSSKSGQSAKTDSHAQAMAWSKSHVAQNNTKSSGSQTGTKTTGMKMMPMKPTSSKKGM